MAWEWGNADVDWMTPVSDYGDQFGATLADQLPTATQVEPTTWGLTAEDWRNIQYITGALGQAALKGTTMEWLGNMGGITAQMAKNAQVSALNKEYQQLIQNINNPKVTGISVTEKGDGTRTVKLDSEVMSPTNQMVTQAATQADAKGPTNAPLTNALLANVLNQKQNSGTEPSKGPSFFAGAQQPWWLRLGK